MTLSNLNIESSCSYDLHPPNTSLRTTIGTPSCRVWLWSGLRARWLWTLPRMSPAASRLVHTTASLRSMNTNRSLLVLLSFSLTFTHHTTMTRHAEQLNKRKCRMLKVWLFSAYISTFHWNSFRCSKNITHYNMFTAVRPMPVCLQLFCLALQHRKCFNQCEIKQFDNLTDNLTLQTGCGVFVYVKMLVVTDIKMKIKFQAWPESIYWKSECETFGQLYY